MKEEELIECSLHRLLGFVEKERFMGYDPYDGLTSPLFRLPVLKNNHQLRFLAQQFIKRSPINLRPLLGIKRRLNPVSLGLGIQAYSCLYQKNKNSDYRKKVEEMIDQLVKLIPTNYTGACWGYDFPWEARYASIPAYQPTVVATGIITNSLYIAHATFNNTLARELVIKGCEFVTTHLNRTVEEDGSFCFSYSPFDREKVFNASMKGSRLLAQGYQLTKNPEWKNLAAQSIAWVMKHQSKEGAWIYSQRNAGQRIDNYHTAYVLDCLDEYIKCTGDLRFTEALKKGVQFYVSHFITKEGQPKFYNNEPWPVDCTAAGQTLLSLVRFGHIDTAKKCALWMIHHMQSPAGNFYFRKFKSHTEKTAFMRWSDSWMLAGLSSLSEHLTSGEQTL
ncbi:MAG: hypothetical protein IPN36_09835 [Bacteroidetes bacterium]|nr:hypothetical protein [Bacteroidota bacterium]